MALDQESRLSYNVASKWTNRYTVAIDKAGRVRFAFAEAAPDETKAFFFHSSVMMDIVNAESLVETLTKIIKGAKK